MVGEGSHVLTHSHAHAIHTYTNTCELSHICIFGTSLYFYWFHLFQSNPNPPFLSPVHDRAGRPRGVGVHRRLRAGRGAAGHGAAARALAHSPAPHQRQGGRR